MSNFTSGFPEINLEDFYYDLPKDRIAQYPADKRDQSKLLHYNRGKITHYEFSEITELIPDGSTLFFNDTRVIPARIFLQRKSGAWIEVFLLEPLLPYRELAQSMAVKESCVWKCLIGNLKKWNDDEVLECSVSNSEKDIPVKVRLNSRAQMHVEFSWDDPVITFSEIIENLGRIPLPPYVNRETEDLDTERYQTVYSKSRGAVAAPTAGLHFTQNIIDRFRKKNISTDFLTLHVSAGTFQPIKSQNIARHPMHSEQILVTKKNIISMLESKFSIAVGTTSMRTLESIYWYGVQIERTGNRDFTIKKDVPYRQNGSIPFKKSLQNIFHMMDENGLDQLHGTTEIFIVPGYEFKSCHGLITNFHMPGSTLILLVAAFIGGNWRKVYGEALKNDYRFLSYGDSSILFPFAGDFN